MTIVQGHIDQESGQACGWANGRLECSVPDCTFSAERCILVQRERGLPPSPRASVSQSVPRP